MESKKLKKGLSSQKHRMVGLKDLKPKIHEGAGFRAHETKGRKKKGPVCQDQRTKKSLVERTGLGSQRPLRARDPWDAQYSQSGIETT